MTSCDLINNGQRGFSVETSKLEAVYFQPGFWGNLHQPLRCLAWSAPGPLPLTPSGAWQIDPRCFSTDSPILPERTESCPEGSLPWREGVSVRRDGLGGYNLHLAHEGQMAERTSSAPKGARLAGPSKTGQESELLAFPAHPLPLLLSLFKKIQ